MKRRLFHKLLAPAAACLLVAHAVPALSVASLNPRPAASPVDVDLSSEQRILDEYARSLLAFKGQVAQLKRRQTVSATEFEGANTSANNLKRRWPEARRSVESAIRKLKAAGLWDQLDAIVSARLRDARARSIINQNGGPASWLEQTVSQFINVDSDLFNDLDALRGKVRAEGGNTFTDVAIPSSGHRVIAVAYSPAAAPRFGAGFTCVVFGLRLLIKSVVKTDTQQDAEDFKEACKEV
ncbi:MAG TPA: hypothetical protein VNO14_18615 [Blastocatellia bacterium]|nr:hypothetical protein [Blastocatellia bacterium]